MVGLRRRIIMKKVILKSAVIAMVVTILLCVMNWLIAAISGKPIGITIWGGEYSARYGFGVLLETFYPLTTVDTPIQSTSNISFDPVSFLVTILIVFVVSMVVGTILRKKSR